MPTAVADLEFEIKDWGKLMSQVFSMTLQEKFKYEYPGNANLAEAEIQEIEFAIRDGKGAFHDYYFATGSTAFYALKCYIEGEKKSEFYAKVAVESVIQYFYGEWRHQLLDPAGIVNPLYWRKRCLWYDEVVHSLPLAAALNDWKLLKEIADYPPEDKLPEASKAKGETAWTWALIKYFRGEQSTVVEAFLQKAEKDKAKRPKLLCAILRAIIAKDQATYGSSFLKYLEFYQRSELKHTLDKLVTLDGTLLYHLGQKVGLEVDLPEEGAMHIIQFVKTK